MLSCVSPVGSQCPLHICGVDKWEEKPRFRKAALVTRLWVHGMPTEALTYPSCTWGTGSAALGLGDFSGLRAAPARSH